MAILSLISRYYYDNQFNTLKISPVQKNDNIGDISPILSIFQSLHITNLSLSLSLPLPPSLSQVINSHIKLFESETLNELEKNTVF